MNPILAAAEPQRDCHPTPAVAESLVALLESRVADSPDRRAIVDGLDAASAARSADSDPAAGPAAMSWAELAAAALLMARRFETSGLERGDRLAHIGPHSADWIVVDLACLLTGMVHVALHADDAAHAVPMVEWIDARGVVTSGGATMPGGAGRIGLRADPEPDACRSLAADRDGLRAELQRRMAACDPDACATILLSSGTTGLPHGVMHSQRSLALNAQAAADVFLDDPRDVRLSWLPMSHAMARTGDLYTTLVRGGCLNVVRDRTRLLDACRALPPTVMLGVPIAFERLERETRAGRIRGLRAALGGGVRVCVSGGAPLRRRTAEFFAAAGVPLVEGYGLAEAGPVVAVASPRTYRPGTVGPPLAGVSVRIDDRPASRGQLLVRTPSRTIGILPPRGEAGDGAPGPQNNADGWIETGDLAEIDDAGHIRITGRLRETLVLSTGVKLPPAVVELALAEDDVVAQVCVAGNGLPWPVAIVVPEPAVLRAAIHRLGVRVLSKRAALEHPRVLAWLGRRLAARQRHLPRAWQVRRALVADRAFAADCGEITGSFKLRRDSIVAHFGDRLAAAATDRAPRGVCVVPLPGRPDDVGPRQPATPAGSWTAACLWRGCADDGGGFAEAAAAAAGSLSESVAGVLDRTADALARLRAENRLYDAPARQPGPAAPLADAPAPPAGKFSRAAEAAVGEAGLWGLAVPSAFGGAGGSMGDLARAICRVAADCPTAAGMLAVHSSIGAVAALAAFGSPDQQRRLLPGLAAGRPLSIFGGTEPEVGCDLAAVRAVLDRHDGGLFLTGTKMFITNAVHGRLVKLLARLDGRPQVALVRLPDADTSTFRLRHYDLHPLRHAHNAALEFHDFPVDEADLLAAPESRDGMAVVWHGLNRGRITLAAQAAGTLRLLLAQARDHARTRTTWRAPIGSRQLVQGRLARIAAGVVACEAVTAWAARAVDTGRSGEFEALVAKVTASTCVREAAIDALGIHGGRAFLVGHPLGDSLHDHFAVTVYEGESDLLGLALLKGLAKHHPAAGGPSANRPLHRAAAWLAWRLGRAAPVASGDRSILDAALRDHARRARRGLVAAALRIDRAIRRHGRELADLQLDAAVLAADARDLMTVLAVAHHADARGDETTLRAADVWCRLALRRVQGGKSAASDHAALAGLGAALVSGDAAIP